ncbi:interferon-induced very large GTPase 1 [Xenopus tropicalis]|uniref:Interferon-induced very large GTPase 1 n=1 Tax=Xenopus tropicalis TaxID=8364 RepID=F6TSY1_XENTR|nr:interferon-induced very large GTPase 1 [Xenopus tropicalis]
MSGENHEIVPPTTELLSKVKETGLDPEHWLPVLDKLLGIKNIHSLQHIQAEDCSVLEDEIRYPWERRALGILFNIPERSVSATQLQGEQNQSLQEKTEKAPEVLTQLNEPRTDGKSQLNEPVNKREEIQKGLEMPTECLVPHRNSVLELIRRFEKLRNIREESWLKRGKLEDEEVIKCASGGLALEGIFQTREIDDLFKKREALLCVPEGFRLVSPEKTSLFLQKEFTCHEEELVFQRIVEKIGLSLSSSITAAFLGFGPRDSESSDLDTIGKQPSEHVYVCTTRYNFIPLASCHFTEDQLRLSEPALNALKFIENLITNNSNEQMLATKCAEFFQSFGSHVNLGPIHFGGILWWKASMEGVEVGDLRNAKEMISEALNFYASVGYDGSGRDIDLSAIDSQSSMDLSKISTFKEYIQVSVTKTGGPSEADSLSQWKTGLVTSKETWSVIDRGFQLMPIWKIIVDNHKDEFPHGLKLVSCLAEHYKLETGLTSDMMVGEYLASVLEKVNQFLQNLKSWKADEATQHLQALLEFKQTLNEATRSSSDWVTLCLSDKGLQDFLVKVVTNYKDSSAEETSMIKASLQELIEPLIYSAENVIRFALILRWIYGFEKNELDPTPVSDFSQLCDVLHQSMEDFQQLNVKLETSTEDEHKAKVKATVIIGLSLSSYLRSLRDMKQSDTELLILCIANNSGYSTEYYHFQSLLGYRNIDFLKNQLQEAYKEFTNLRGQSVHQAQAFVIYTGLASTGESREISLEQKRERLNFMKRHLSDKLSSDVDAIITQYSGYQDWREMESHLKSFIHGSVTSRAKEIKRDEVAKELNDICHKEAHVETDSNKMNISSLLKRLDLEKYYPQKMQTSDFHKICRYSLIETESLEEKQLPFYFLQKLLMLDYSAKYVQCKKGRNSTELNPMNIDEKFNTDTSEDSYEQFFDDFNDADETNSTSDPTIHPMDVQMAVLHCANEFMRQYIYTKLSFCQFALPLLVPNPNTNSIEFPLWSFQEVKKKWKTKSKDTTENGKSEDTFITGTNTYFVSFIRLGQSPSSKSQIMNWVMSKQRHNIFYHRHCPGATKNPLLMDGIAEIAWYCPGGKKDDVFDDCIAFTNLHGDAREYDQQVRFLEQVSSVIVVLFTDEDTKEKRGKELLQRLLKSPKPLICLLADKEQSQRAPGSKVKIGLRNRNEAELLEEIRAAIRSVLTKAQVKVSLNKCAETARTCGFLVDEDRGEIQQGKEKTQVLLSLLGGKKVSDIKQEFLPLQGDLWHEWCVKDKEMTRLKEQSNESIEQQRSKIEHRKRMIRKKQLEKAFPLNDFMRSFLEILQSDVQGPKLHFLQWFKMYLDNLSSQTLSVLYQEYHNVWSKVKEEKHQRKNLQTIGKIENHLEKLSGKINISTFGLEHILRELGQIYEALDTTNKKDNIYFILPKIAANLMVSGYPVELMDGDAAHVPLRWVGAVMKKLIEILGDKRLYVLSVLGIQSTGKSTLLNAMFGLQFAVSAGRCTRGAFMQLIKVDEELTREMNFDYVLVVDTEGLRALELSKKTSMNHDNELATFVIGLGNLTLINIFGENPSEMQDILQIAVQAFLRMKKVNLRPSCIFVHQNVGEITAEEKNMEGRRRLQGKLDEMAQCAAQQEQCDVTCFNDVIKFDVNTHIHYFAHLWEGDPPMAPPNPSYSQNVQKLKQVILGSGKLEEQQHILSISQFKTRVEDLWNALLNENFVFSFRNSLEIAAYNKLEVKYRQWSWTLRKHMLTLQTQINNKISNDQMNSVDVMSLTKEFEPERRSVMKDCKEFFDDEKDKEILVQWRVSTERRLTTVLEDLVDDIRKKADELIRAKQNNEKVREMKEKYVDEMLEKSRDMALTLKGQNITEIQLEGKFNEMWYSLVLRVSREIQPPKPPGIDQDLQYVFLERFRGESNLIDTISDSWRWTNLSEEFYKYISTKRKFIFLHEKLSNDRKREIEDTTRALSRRVDDYIDRKQWEKVDYQSVYFHEILTILQSEIGNMLGREFKFLHEYTLFVSLFLCRRAARRFNEMSIAFREANDPQVYLQSKKNELWQNFRISCEGTKQTASLVDFLCNKLRDSIQQAVTNKTAIQLAGDLQGDHPALNGNRSKLEFCLLKSLAEKENFSHYINYITDPKSAVSDFIKDCVDQHCDAKAKAKAKVTGSLSTNVDHFRNIILKAIDTSTGTVTEKGGDNISSWLDTFCSELGSDMKLSIGDLKSVKYQGITDVGFLKEAMIKALDTGVEELKRDFSTSDLKDLKKKTHEILMGQFSGCWKRCPFCKAVCTNTIPGHDGDHSVKFHWPLAIRGTNWHKTDEFAVEICSSFVASDYGYVLSEDNKIPYKTYRDGGPPFSTWSITPDNSSLSYWKWVMCRFKSDLEKHYKFRFAGKGKIPQHWHNITKQEAIQEIENLM